VGRLLSYISKFEAIETDRLQICIAAVMLNKKVNFFKFTFEVQGSVRVFT